MPPTDQRIASDTRRVGRSCLIPPIVTILIDAVDLGMKTERSTIRSYARVSAMLKERIASGEFEIGARLPPERELTIFYEVSRSTIREAIIALETEKVVSVRPGSGVYVISKRSRLGMKYEIDIDILEILQARRSMEPEACALAASRIDIGGLEKLANNIMDIKKAHSNNDIIEFEYCDRQFHLTIAEATGNAAVRVVIDTLFDVRSFESQNGALIGKLWTLSGARDFENYHTIVESLKCADQYNARIEMQNYHTIIISSVLDDMELKEIEHIRASFDFKRKSYQIN